MRESMSCLILTVVVLAAACGGDLEPLREEAASPTTKEQPDHPQGEAGPSWKSDGTTLVLSAAVGEVFLIVPRPGAGEGKSDHAESSPVAWRNDAALAVGGAVDVYRVTPVLRCGGVVKCNECDCPPGSECDDCPPVTPPKVAPLQLPPPFGDAALVLWTPQGRP